MPSTELGGTRQPLQRWATGMYTASSIDGPAPLIPIKDRFWQRCVAVLLWGTMIVYTFLILFGDWLILPKDEIAWCPAAQQGYPTVITRYPNPDTNNNPCYYEHTLYLLGMSPFEADFSRRMITSVFLGSAIGWERKAADRPAGVRTMSLVCLGACFFTMCGQHAFKSSTQTWDAARVSAAIPSGVSFLGSALIWKHTTGDKYNQKHEVHGLTTAASVWLSASVGIGAGGHLYVVSIYAVILVIFVLRLGPRMMFTDDGTASLYNDSEFEDEEEEVVEEQASVAAAIEDSTGNTSGGKDQDSSEVERLIKEQQMEGQLALRKTRRNSRPTFHN